MKSQEMETALEVLFGRTTKMEQGKCVICDEAITEFRDELSRREYAISGMCQKCQDKVF